MDGAAAHKCAIIDNGDDRKATYWRIKEAIATLSPIVRNRLHGIPAYILDYADLIISNQVEQPFLKPVLLTGPCTDEKWDFLQTLADEFPDVFAFPTVYTDEPAERPADPHANACASFTHSLRLLCIDLFWVMSAQICGVLPKAPARSLLQHYKSDTCPRVGSDAKDKRRRKVSCRCMYVCRPKAPSTSARRSSRAARTAAAAVTLPARLAASLEEQEPLPVDAVDADVIEDSAPEHAIFPPRTALLPSPDTAASDPQAGANGIDDSLAAANAEYGSSQGSTQGEAAVEAEAVAAATRGSMRGAERVVPPRAARVTAAEFDELVAQGAFAATQERLFRHAKCRARVGARLLNSLVARCSNVHASHKLCGSQTSILLACKCERFAKNSGLCMSNASVCRLQACGAGAYHGGWQDPPH